MNVHNFYALIYWLKLPFALGWNNTFISYYRSICYLHIKSLDSGWKSEGNPATCIQTISSRPAASLAGQIWKLKKEIYIQLLWLEVMRDKVGQLSLLQYLKKYLKKAQEKQYTFWFLFNFKSDWMNCSLKNLLCKNKQIMYAKRMCKWVRNQKI